ncbi:signal peptidase I [Clostridium acidisoli DSM 12555]|uniref:Signal peptidase I n=1 Tax=Clostridium acidisoli DSM 12555 TaxID=1121291 RepID=A0A1W1XV34_9CLOT|nr:signal peptidase I [Clostridium acidisoli]SMC27401.1 signal peptidase I [Clostridium acidisoli DSM 12555]
MKNIKKEVINWTICIGSAIVFSLTLRTYVFARAVVNQTSMLPTLKPNDSVITENISPHFLNVKRGEIITFDSGDVSKDKYIKRVIAIEGDEIEITNGKIYLNGSKLDEKYIDSTIITNGGTYLHENQKIKIKKGFVFVLGDNRSVSNDSRNFGPINIKSIDGHVVLRIYPFKKINPF